VSCELRGEWNGPLVISVDDAVLVVIYQLETPNPSELIRYVLRDERELARFLLLGAAFDKFVDLIGPQGSLLEPLNTDEPCGECVAAARSLRAVSTS
jgi:hypothetical protein